MQCDSVAWPRLSIIERIIVMAVDNFFDLGVLKISIKVCIPQRMLCEMHKSNTQNFQITLLARITSNTFVGNLFYGYGIPCGGCFFPSTSTSSSYCTVALPGLKTMQYEASDTGKHCESRLRDSQLATCTYGGCHHAIFLIRNLTFHERSPSLMVTVRGGHL